MIGELDEKKREALHASWVKVNQDFGSIFTSLLPGTMAKLEPPEGQSFLAGLEVKASNDSCHHTATFCSCTSSLGGQSLDHNAAWCLEVFAGSVLLTWCFGVEAV